MNKKLLILSSALFIAIISLAALLIHYEGQKDVRLLISEQKERSIPYQWLKEGIDSGELTRKQLKRAKANLSMMERGFKRQAKEWAAQGITLGSENVGIILSNENTLQSKIDFHEAEEIAREKVKEYQYHEDNEALLKAIVYADHKAAYIRGFTGYNSQHSPFYLVFFEGEFIIHDTSQNVSYGMLQVNPQTGKVNRVSLSPSLIIDSYVELQKIEYEEGSSRVY